MCVTAIYMSNNKNMAFSRYVLAEHCSGIRDIATTLFLHAVIILYYIYEVYLPIDFVFVLFFTFSVSINITRPRHVRIRRAEHIILEHAARRRHSAAMDATCTRGCRLRFSPWGAFGRFSCYPASA